MRHQDAPHQQKISPEGDRSQVRMVRRLGWARALGMVQAPHLDHPLPYRPRALALPVSMALMPWVICPACQHCSERQHWPGADGQRIPFRRRCPSCGQDFDVAELETRLMPPDPDSG